MRMILKKDLDAWLVEGMHELGDGSRGPLRPLRHHRRCLLRMCWNLIGLGEGGQERVESPRLPRLMLGSRSPVRICG